MSDTHCADTHRCTPLNPTMAPQLNPNNPQQTPRRRLHNAVTYRLRSDGDHLHAHHRCSSCWKVVLTGPPPKPKPKQHEALCCLYCISEAFQKTVRSYLMAARAALLPRVTKGLIDLGLRQKSSLTTLRDKPEVRRSCFGCQELLGPAICACIAPPNVGMRIHRWSWWKFMCRLTG